MCKLIKLSLGPDDDNTRLYHVMVRGLDDPVGKLTGLDNNNWIFELTGNGSDLIPQNLRKKDGEYFTSFEEAKTKIIG